MRTTGTGGSVSRRMKSLVPAAGIVAGAVPAARRELGPGPVAQQSVLAGPAGPRSAVKSEVRPQLTVIVPTRNEAANVVALLNRVDAALEGMDAEVLFVDDSTDGTPQTIEAVRQGFNVTVRLYHRSPDLRWGGLGGAVVDGFRLSRSPYAVVMDGDLQHPPEALQTLYDAAVVKQADMVIASRYRGDGDAAGLASGVRRFVSSGANLVSRLAFPRRLRGVTDVMSGFFLVRVDALRLDQLQPSGYKILLELLVRTDKVTVAEVPYSFAERHAGESNASVFEGLRFIRHLFWLRVPRAARFALVGATGLVPNILTTAILAAAGLHYIIAAVVATQIANVWNFIGCELLVWHDRKGSWRRRMAPFMLLNSCDLVFRLPLLAFFVEKWGLGAGTGTLLTLVVAFALRFLLIDRLVYRNRADKPPARRPDTTTVVEPEAVDNVLVEHSA
ncbi:glycosyltransferase family 2 protein [Frankia sp. Cr1]|uniref:glycosyltransferase family 2 protein n=1 Tax=Frankia sp. Cr1 TaxID=3073931 RepID=UPI002AD2DEF7|nr:glycosyltransferase family 2 protein [Frankia sp. Cr1]